MTNKSAVQLLGAWILFASVLIAWLYCGSPDRRQTPEQTPEAAARSAAQAAAAAAEEARTNQAFDATFELLERTKVLMKFEQLSGLTAYAKAYLDPVPWAALTFEEKKKVGMVLYHKAGNNPVYILDGYSGKQLARQGPLGLDIK